MSCPHQASQRLISIIVSCFFLISIIFSIGTTTAKVNFATERPQGDVPGDVATISVRPGALIDALGLHKHGNAH